MNCWYVCYEALGKKVAAGPYMECEVDSHFEDIKGYVGFGADSQVRGVWKTTTPPAEYRRLNP